MKRYPGWKTVALVLVTYSAMLWAVGAVVIYRPEWVPRTLRVDTVPSGPPALSGGCTALAASHSSRS